MLSELSFSISDKGYMARAITLALKGLYTCAPNPRVGCVIVKDEKIVGEGWHHQAGQAHAEINALRQAGENSRGACAYVTLEPCSHYGKTPPCATALVNAGIRQVNIGMEDPNPDVAGKGIKMLVNAGLQVRSGLLEDEVKKLNPGFIRRMLTQKPLVRCKMAMSLDGRTAMRSGESKWITGKTSREDVQRLRGRSCAIITGFGTVLEDNPSLTFRFEESGLLSHEVIMEKQPLRVIVDSRLETPPDAKILTCPGNVIIACGHLPEGRQALFFDKLKEKNTLRAVGKNIGENRIEVIELPDTDGRVDLDSLIKLLGQRECNEVLVEAGATLAGQAVRQGLVNELYLYMAPVLLGSTARPLFSFSIERLCEKIRMSVQEYDKKGEDLRVIATFDESPGSAINSVQH